MLVWSTDFEDNTARFVVERSADGGIFEQVGTVDASGNNNAFRMLARDVENITAYCARQAPELRNTFYAHEIWKLYQSTELRPDSVLTGEHVFDDSAVDVDEVLAQIEEARFEAEARQRGREQAEADAD